jgi:hypothetical protein
MSTFLVTCPSCSQNITCEQQFAGHQIQCPFCEKIFTAPRLKTAASKQDSSSDKTKLIIGIAIAAILVPAAIYFAVKWQGKFNVQAEEAAKNSDGGQIGHIGALYETLEATDPKRYEKTSGSLEAAERRSREMEAERHKPKPELPIIPPAWDLDLSTAQIATSKVNGTVAGTNFVADVVHFDKSSTAYVLSLRKGTNAFPDCEVLIILRLKPGQAVETNSWNVSKEMRSGIPQIVKKLKTGPKLFAQKTVLNGYAMKLELGEIADGNVPGKIYLVLPDKEQTVIAGQFEAQTQLIGAKEQSFLRFRNASGLSE